MAAAFSKEATAIGFQMPKEIDSLHAGSRREALSDHRHSNEILLGKRTIGFQNEFYGLAEVRARLIKRIALGIRAGQLLHEGDVAALRGLAKHGSQFQ